MRANPTVEVEDPELFFISGKMFDVDIPKEQKWLLKYFKVPVQRQFLFYYLTLGDPWNFSVHTGYASSKRSLFRLRYKLEKLLDLHKKAKDNFDFELLTKLETGRYKRI